MTDGDRKAKVVGINHVALEVDDVDEAFAFYRRFLDFEVTSRNEDIAFVYFDDQFINFTRGAGRTRMTSGTSVSRWTTKSSFANG